MDQFSKFQEYLLTSESCIKLYGKFLKDQLLIKLLQEDPTFANHKAWTSIYQSQTLAN